jgi:hypothetical protein
MNEDVLFREMDLDGDGKLTRDEIYHAATHCGWQWQQASIYALLDLMAVLGPIDPETFITYMTTVGEDRDGAYGEALRMVTRAIGIAEPPPLPAVEPIAGGPVWQGLGIERVIASLERNQDRSFGEDFKAALKKLNTPRITVATGKTGLLIIDPQCSFTEGSWKRSLGPDGDQEVMPVEAAFDNCADLLKALKHRTQTIFTRCPFPPDSYGWDKRFEGVIDPGQHYFIKPGNCVLLPDTNGFREWLENMIDRGMKSLVMGGCTLNSCLRISSLEVISAFHDTGLNIIVDLSLCGARASNYGNSTQFGGISGVEMAINQMKSEGVKVTEGVEWSV